MPLEKAPHPGDASSLYVPPCWPWAVTIWTPDVVTDNAVRMTADESFVAYLVNRATFSSDTLAIIIFPEIATSLPNALF